MAKAKKRRAHKRGRRKTSPSVSVAAACAAIRALGNRRKNPVRHFPKMKGRGRPAKTKKWDMVTRLTDGKIAEKSFRATQSEAYAMARRIARRTFHGKRVAEIILDDGK